jgi:L-aspartate oxidase
MERLRRAMTRDAGVERNARGLQRLSAVIEQLQGAGPPPLPLVSARLIAEAALAREESRGAHHRTDFPAAGAVARHTRVALGRCDPSALAA